MRHRIYMIASICCVMALLLSGCSGRQKQLYTDAKSLMKSGDYESAIEIFSKISNYEDSSSRIAECTYYLGITAMESEDWDSAISYFTGLEFENSEDLLEICITEKGMTENEDYEFLEAIEDAVLYRRRKSRNWSEDSTVDDYAELVEGELDLLRSYKWADFYDSGLEAIAERYLWGLYQQYGALNLEYEWDIQIAWQRGKVYRYKALCDLYEDYGFLADDEEFIETYVEQYENEQAILNTYRAIQKDLFEQMNADDFGFYADPDTGYTYVTPFVNNTEYTYSVVFYVRVLNSSFEEYEVYYLKAESIEPGASFYLSFYVEDVESFTYLDLQHYFMEI